jgi:hypothetical protein
LRNLIQILIPIQTDDLTVFSRHGDKDKTSASLRFAFSQPALDGVLVALSHPREVRHLADALAAGPMAEDDQRYLITLAKARRSVQEGR